MSCRPAPVWLSLSGNAQGTTPPIISQNSSSRKASQIIRPLSKCHFGPTVRDPTLQQSQGPIARIQLGAKSASQYSLLIYTDLPLLVNQLTQTWQIRAANLRPPVDEARSLKAAFGCCDLVKVPRDDVPTAGACVGALARSAARQTSATSPVPHGDRVLFFLGIELY
jgi:hypothetical protein